MKTSEQKTVSPRTKTCSALLQTAATGELEGDYRRIVYVVQENRLGPTGKSIWSYREIAWGLQGNCLGATGKSVSEYWISPLPQCRLKGVDGEAVGGGGNFFFFMGEGVTMIASSGR